ncbi:MAG: YggT family protein [Clostridia bacterium]|nr:YggT family protein [Clostridia bacterium]
MDTFVYLLSSIIYLLCNIAMLMLAVRAILSWFPGLRGGIVDVIYAFTEPLLLPVRKLLYKARLDSLLTPLDFSFIITYLLLVIIRLICGSLL